MDYHKRYSVLSVLDEAGQLVQEGGPPAGAGIRNGSGAFAGARGRGLRGERELDLAVRGAGEDQEREADRGGQSVPGTVDRGSADQDRQAGRPEAGDAVAVERGAGDPRAGRGSTCCGSGCSG